MVEEASRHLRQPLDLLRSSRHFRDQDLRLIIAKKGIFVIFDLCVTHRRQAIDHPSPITIVENHEIRYSSNPSHRIDHSTISAVLLVVFIPSYASVSFEKSRRCHERHRAAAAAATTPPALRPSRRPFPVFDNKR